MIEIMKLEYSTYLYIGYIEVQIHQSFIEFGEADILIS